MSTWTFDDIPDQTDKIAVITGANTGIGFHMARHLIKNGAHVVMACRTKSRAETAAASIREEFNVDESKLKVMVVDVSDQDSVRVRAGLQDQGPAFPICTSSLTGQSFAKSFASEYDHVDLLINNAGIMATPYAMSPQKIEMQFATNHLGPFLLTGLMMPLLQKSKAARVVAVSSLAHRQGAWKDLEEINDATLSSGANSIGRYTHSKLSNLWFTYELQRRLDKANINNVMAVAAHPGGSSTELGRGLTTFYYFLHLLASPFTQTSEMGAAPELRAATDPSVQKGDYYGPAYLGEIRGPPIKAYVQPIAQDKTYWTKLWKLSSEITNFDYLEE